MYFSKCLAAAISAASYVAAAPTAAVPKLLICSDSTTANYATTDALQGLVLLPSFPFHEF